MIKKIFKFNLLIQSIFLISSCALIPGVGVISNTIEAEAPEKTSHLLIGTIGIITGVVIGTLANQPDIQVKNKINLNVNERLEIDFKIIKPKTREVLKIVSLNPDIVKVISEKGGVILGNKKGITKLKMTYANVIKEIEVEVNDANIKF